MASTKRQTRREAGTQSQGSPWRRPSCRKDPALQLHPAGSSAHRAPQRRARGGMALVAGFVCRGCGPRRRSVRFTRAAESDFDKHTSSPSAGQATFMRDSFWRMRTYAPYFDSRLSWYRNAWTYKDLYAVYRDGELARGIPSGSCGTPRAASSTSPSAAGAAPAPSTPATSATPRSAPTGSRRSWSRPPTTRASSWTT